MNQQNDQAENLRNVIKAKDVVTSKEQKKCKVITITSGKGGVGKSNLSANLAISLKKLGNEVLIIDADLGLANIEVIFNVIPKKTLKNVIIDGEDIENVVSVGPMGIHFLSGGSGIKDITRISQVEQDRFISALSKFDDTYDYILIDTGAGISDLIINFVRASHEAIILVTPEPTSVTDAYALIKVLSENIDNKESFSLVINRVEDKEEGDSVFNKLTFVANKFLDLELKSFGYIRNDELVTKSVKLQTPISIQYPNAEYVRDIDIIAKRIADIEVDDIEFNEKGSFFNRLVKLFNKQ